MIISTPDVDQITKDLVNDTFAIQLETHDQDRAGYGARLTAEWNVSIEISTSRPCGPITELAFFDTNEDATALDDR